MKTRAILFILALSVTSAFGQGQVTFQNSAFAHPIMVYSGGTPQLMPAGGNVYSFYFIYGTTPENLNYTSATYFNHETADGRITTDGTQEITLQVPGYMPVFFQLFAFETAFGSYSAALGGARYQSDVITLIPSEWPDPGTPMFGSTVGTRFQGFTLGAPIPEPSTFVFGLIGAGALLFLRRKR